MKINKHYRDIIEQLRSDIGVRNAEIIDRNLVTVPITSITTAVGRSIYYTQMLANNDVIAVHVSSGDEDRKAFQEEWKRHSPDIRLVILYSEYRSIMRLISYFTDKINRKAND